MTIYDDPNFSHGSETMREAVRKFRKKYMHAHMYNMGEQKLADLKFDKQIDLEKGKDYTRD